MHINDLSIVNAARKGSLFLKPFHSERFNETYWLIEDEHGTLEVDYSSINLFNLINRVLTKCNLCYDSINLDEELGIRVNGYRFQAYG